MSEAVKCPLCNGTGVPINGNTGEPDGPPGEYCHVCNGTGEDPRPPNGVLILDPSNEAAVKILIGQAILAERAKMKRYIDAKDKWVSCATLRAIPEVFIKVITDPDEERVVVAVAEEAQAAAKELEPCR